MQRETDTLSAVFTYTGCFRIILDYNFKTAKIKRWYNFAEHRHNVNVLISNITFVIFFCFSSVVPPYSDTAYNTQTV